MTTASQHDWLRRVSDYHSGDMDAAEAIAVEEHLAGCEDCRQALAVYRRFYVLASSPLRLGEPSGIVAEQLALSTDMSSALIGGDALERRPNPRGSRRPERNRRPMGIASVLAASLIIVGFLAVMGPRISSVGGHTTAISYPSAIPASHFPTVQPNSTAASP